MGVVTLLGRMLLSLIFVLGGLHKAVDFSATIALMAAHDIPATPVLALGTILVEVGGGVCVLLGYRARLAATLLALFLIPVTAVFHTNLVVTNTGIPQEQMVHCLKNLAIIGGLLGVAAHGPGTLSMDGRKRPSQRLL